MINAKELLEKCEQELKRSRWGLLWKSVRSEFGGFRRDFFENTIMNEKETERFFKVCDNRIDYAQKLLGQLTTSVSILISAILIFFSLLIDNFTFNPEQSYPFIHFFEKLSPVLLIFLMLVALLLVIMLISLLFYRIEYHAWYAFKEGALLLQVGIEDPPLASDSGNCL